MTKGHILLVDDDADSRDVVDRYLAKSGFSVRSSPNGREALIAVATSVPDVIILDAMMPEMNGLEFLNVIRSYLRWQTIPIILLTAFDKGEHIDRASEFGVHGVFLKANFRLADLVACIRLLLSDPTARCSNAG
jgi:DNA-binding response OmpR family regulator